MRGVYLHSPRRLHGVVLNLSLEINLPNYFPWAGDFLGLWNSFPNPTDGDAWASTAVLYFVCNMATVAAAPVHRYQTLAAVQCWCGPCLRVMLPCRCWLYFLVVPSHRGPVLYKSAWLLGIHFALRIETVRIFEMSAVQLISTRCRRYISIQWPWKIATGRSFETSAIQLTSVRRRHCTSIQRSWKIATGRTFETSVIQPTYVRWHHPEDEIVTISETSAVQPTSKRCHHPETGSTFL